MQYDTQWVHDNWKKLLRDMRKRGHYDPTYKHIINTVSLSPKRDQSAIQAQPWGNPECPCEMCKYIIELRSSQLVR